MEKLAALEGITSQTLRDFAAEIWGAAAHVEGMVIGNVTADEALAMGSMIRGTLKVRPVRCCSPRHRMMPIQSCPNRLDCQKCGDN